MKSISYWAKANPIKARFIIVLSHIFLFGLSFQLGVLQYYEEFILPRSILYLLSGIFGIIILLYPTKRNTRGLLAYSYYRQKCCDFALLSIGFLMLTLTAADTLQQTDSTALNMGRATARLIVLDHIPAESFKSKKAQRKSLKQRFKQWKQHLKQKFKRAKNKYKTKKRRTTKALSNGAKAMRVFLTIILGVALLYLVLVLSCSLSCSGQEGLAAIVAIGGIALVIFGAVAIIRNITRKPPDSIEEFKKD